MYTIFLNVIESKCEVDDEVMFEVKVFTGKTHPEFERKYEMDLHEEKSILGRLAEYEKVKKVLSYASEKVKKFLSYASNPAKAGKEIIA